MTTIDYAKGAAAPSAGLTQEKLNAIGALCRQEVLLWNAVVAAERLLEQANANYDRLVKDILPTMLTEAGVTELTLDGGWEVKVADDVRANITEENRTAAHAWLRENGQGSLVKTVITAKFGMGEDKKAQALYNTLAKKYESVDKKEAVHPSTLKSFVREVLAGKVVVAVKDAKGKLVKEKQGKLTRVVTKPLSLPETITYVSLPVATIKEPKGHEQRKETSSK